MASARSTSAICWDSSTARRTRRAPRRSLPDDLKPANSHVALTTIEEDGEERQILRYNMPFGRVGAQEFGTYFIGYARTPGVIEQMLRNMFVGDPPGNHDRILDFSTAATGTLFFVPTVDLLEGAATPSSKPAREGGEPAGRASLGIGASAGKGDERTQRTPIPQAGRNALASRQRARAEL
jgi:putative iron-dependent peroxidase